MKKQSLTFKYLVIGDSGVGKTCILMRYCQDTFQSDLLSTVGVDFKIKRTHIEGKELCLNIWDTAGQQRFKNITKSFYKNAHGIVVAYSIDSMVSFQHVEHWIEQIKENGGDQVSIILVANKADMEDRRKVSRQMGEDLSLKHRIRFLEVSAKQNRNVRETFETLTKEVLIKNNGKIKMDPVATVLNDGKVDKKGKKKNDCCN